MGLLAQLFLKGQRPHELPWTQKGLAGAGGSTCSENFTFDRQAWGLVFAAEFWLGDVFAMFQVKFEDWFSLRIDHAFVNSDI